MQLSSKISSNHFPRWFTTLQFNIKYVTNGLVQNHTSYLTQSAPISYIMPTYVYPALTVSITFLYQSLSLLTIYERKRKHITPLLKAQVFLYCLKIETLKFCIA